MTVRYTDERGFTVEQLERLFLSVEWESGKFPEKLKKAMDNSAAVFTAWDGDRLVGSANALDDGELTAYVHYLLVDPADQGQGIGTALLELMKKKYADYFHFFLLAEHENLINYYERTDFEKERGVSAMKYKEQQ